MRYGMLWLATAICVANLGCAAKSSVPGDDETTTPPDGCTEIGCQDGLIVRVTPMEAWPHGEYRFDIEVDGEAISCTGSLPLPECGTSGHTCDGTGLVLTESGCALDPSQHAFGDIMFSSTPSSVSIDVELDEQAVGSGSWTPEYQTVQPNGPDCEPTCTNAAVDLPLTFD